MRIVKIFESQTTVNKRFVLLPLKKKAFKSEISDD